MWLRKMPRRSPTECSASSRIHLHSRAIRTTERRLIGECRPASEEITMETATRGRKKRRRRDRCRATRWIRAQLYSVVTSTLVCDSNYTAWCRVRNWGTSTSHRHRFMRTRKGNRSSSFGEDEICVSEFRPGCEVRIGTQPRARSRM
jgi:hypothetical protein